MIEACRSGYIELAGPTREQGDVHVNLGIAHYARGEVAEGDSELSSLRRLFAGTRPATSGVGRRPKAPSLRAAKRRRRRLRRGSKIRWGI